jgi:hypothetical protein
LGTAAGFGVLAAGAISNTGLSNVTGNLGVDPSAAVVGFPPGVVTGTIYKDDSVALQAKDDLATAYIALAGDLCTENLTGQNLGGLTLTPGVYCYSSAASLSGTLTLNTEGDTNGLYVFQIEGSLTASGSSSVIMTSGSGCNVFWQIGGSAVLGSQTAFAGSILSVGAITMGAGANITGVAMTQDGSVAMSTNHVASQCSHYMYDSSMSQTPTPGTGCWESTYPSATWEQVACVSEKVAPTNVGSSYGDNPANSGSTHIGYAQGIFSSVMGITSESDSSLGSGYYSLQINSQYFTCTPASGTQDTYSGGNTGCWEQFDFENNPGTGSQGLVYIEYWLLDYTTQSTGGCPSTAPYSGWQPEVLGTNLKYDCWGYTKQIAVPNQPATNTGLAALIFTGMSNNLSSGNDEVDLCNGSYCYNWSVSDSELSLQNSWNSAEFNVFGSSNSQANFNTPSTSITVGIYLEDQSGNLLTPTCGTGSTTHETNDLSLGTCSTVNPPSAHITFTET